MPPAIAIPLVFASLAASTGLGIQQGQQAKQSQRRALREQKAAQKAAENRALSAERREAQERRRLNRRGPEVDLSLEQRASRAGPASTLLTGPAGVARDNLKLGRTSLLGGS